MIFCLPAALLSLVVSQLAAAAKPNVILILTDDQDKRLDSMSYMPNVTNLLGNNGVTFDKHYCTVAWCCPSRVNLLTGRAAHNTNVTTLNPPFGGWPKFVDQNLNDNYLPRWLQAAGVRTYYVGKLMNTYQENNWREPYPKGWTHSSFCIDPWTYNYYNTAWTNGDADSGINSYNGTHATDVTEQKALDFLDDAAANSQDQFFLMIAPVAPHAQMKAFGQIQEPPPAPEKYLDAFPDAISPRVPNFNPDVPSGVGWVYNKPKQTDKQVNKNDNWYRHRIRNVAGLDDMVANIVQRLQDHNLLDNTFIIYTTDNGFHIGNHRLDPGKRCGYEEDINIPLLIRGPGVASGYVSNITSSHTDIAPTVLQMLGIPLRPDFDGEPIPLTQPDLSNSTKYEHVNVEFWDSPGTDPWVHDNDGDYHPSQTYYNNTYKSIRIHTTNASFYYSVWCTGDKELYDMTQDPYQMTNIFTAANVSSYDSLYLNRPWDRVAERLDALLMVLKSCQGVNCTNPYGVLFPKTEVASLEQAMDTHYDTYFSGVANVSFNGCFTGHIPQLEGTLEIKAYSAASRERCLELGGFTVLALAWVGLWAFT